MAATSLTTNHFLTLEEELSVLLIQLNEFTEKLTKFKESGYQSFRESYAQYLVSWQQTVESTRSFFQELPKEVKKKEIYHQMAQKVDLLGLQLNGIAQQIYNIDTAKLTHRVKDLLPDFDQLRSSADALAENFRTFKVEPLIQKIIASGKSLAGKHQLQWSRKIFHTLSGLIGLWLWAYSGLQESTVLIILGIYFTYAVSTEIFRKIFPAYNRWMLKTCGRMMREHEKHTISSATYYLGSMFFVMLVYPKEVSILTLFFIAVGDTAAGIVGVLWGKHKITKHASLEGTLACFTVCFLATVFFVSGAIPQFELHGLDIYLFSFIAGIIACVAESSIKKLDDNLVMPMLSAPALTWLVHFFK